MSNLYILDTDGRPTPTDDVKAWGRWFEDTERRRVAWYEDKERGISVSTVFLGMDHGWGDGPAVLWETMVFGGDLDGEQDRYTSLADAHAGHAAMVERVEGAIRRPRAHREGDDNVR